jgi:hypothetical protein
MPIARVLATTMMITNDRPVAGRDILRPGGLFEGSVGMGSQDSCAAWQIRLF